MPSPHQPPLGDDHDSTGGPAHRGTDGLPVYPGTTAAPVGFEQALYRGYLSEPIPEYRYQEWYDLVGMPSGRVAKTASVLALIGAVWALMIALFDVGDLVGVHPGPVFAVLLIEVIALVIEVPTLAVGAIMLRRHRVLGRRLVAGGCAVHVVQAVTGFLIMALPGGHLYFSTDGSGPLGLSVGILPAVVTLVLTLLPATARWCAWRTGAPVAGR